MKNTSIFYLSAKLTTQTVDLEMLVTHEFNGKWMKCSILH